MSMRAVMAGYAFTLALFVVGCTVIERSSPGLRGIRRLRHAFSVALAGVLLLASRPLLPSFFSMTLGNMALFATYVLIHRAINEILEIKELYLPFSIALGSLMFLAFLYYTGVHPSMAARIYISTAATGIQTAVTASVLFRCHHPTLRDPARGAGITLAAVSVLHVLRIVMTIIWPPSPDLMHPDPFQAAFILLNCIIAVGFGLSLIWLALCAQRTTLQTVAITDGLTGQLNRRAFEEALQRELAWAHRQRTATGLVLIDLDFFKNINDTHGHPAGDEVIRRVSAVLHIGLRSSDAIARFGGEEFVMMLRDTDLPQTKMIAERIRQQVETLRNLPGNVHITVSIGAAVSAPSDTIESLLKKTDNALYRSKHSGRNTVTCHYDTAVDLISVQQPCPELLSTGN
jgi:diguanylate cyclase (GGDEF)-like protein